MYWTDDYCIEMTTKLLVFLGAVFAPEAQRDYSRTLPIQLQCVAPTSTSSAVAPKVVPFTL